MDFSPEEFDEILNIFREETDEIIDKLNNNLLRLENTPKDKEILVYMFRDAHSLKGAARMIGFNNIQRLAHKVEDVLGLAKENKISINHTISDILYKSLDFLSDIIQKSISIKKEYYTDDIQKYIDDIDETINSNEAEDDLKQNSGIKEQDENFNADLFKKETANIDALIIESLLIMSKMEMDDEIKYLDEGTSFVVQDENAESNFLNFEVLDVLTRYNIKYEVTHIVSSGLVSKYETTSEAQTESTSATQETQTSAAN